MQNSDTVPMTLHSTDAGARPINRPSGMAASEKMAMAMGAAVKMPATWIGEQWKSSCSGASGAAQAVG